MVRLTRFLVGTFAILFAASARGQAPDPAIIRMADYVDAKGFDAVLSPDFLRVMGIPNSGRAVSMKRLTQETAIDEGNGPVLRAIMTLVTDRRYVYFMSTDRKRGWGTVISENGSQIGGIWLNVVGEGGNVFNGTTNISPFERTDAAVHSEIVFWRYNINLRKAGAALDDILR